jgi:hypothetical protein
VLGSGFPSTVPVHDLTIHAPTSKLVAWTHGRSAFSIDIGAPQGINSQSNLAFEYKLFQNYPNPFNPTTNIKYQIANNSLVSLKVYDILGKEIATLVNSKQSPGTYEVSFEGSNLASGIYFYKLSVDNDQISIKRMTLLK